MTGPLGKKSNRLIHSTSPYLLQHAYNPVDWFEWGADALQKAKAEDKPILISIGYSSCHWCHVMEHESFENDEIASIMNEYFVCIKVDREERPDIDQIYMDAVQAMQVNGGWPLNVFLTPDQQPFYGGTYFPPAGWTRLLQQINKAFQTQRKEIDESAVQLQQHLNTSDLKRFAREDNPFGPVDYETIFHSLENKFDPLWGGLDKAPKFVMPSIWRWLLYYHQATGQQKALDMVRLTLQQLANGGIYDQVGGGFSRYSVDGEWFAPHFEKMLYDNAQLLSLYSEAYRITKDPLFKRIVYETVGWLEREMMNRQGGFYSALDADSEGVEGKFYTWTAGELNQLLDDKAPVVIDYFNTTTEGNWEHGRNILYRKPGATDSHDEIEKIKSKLLTERSKRIRPGLDDKILTGWNAMAVRGLVDCFNALDDPHFLKVAKKNIQFLEENLIEGKKCFRAFKGKRSTTAGFLEDYAFLIQAYLALYEATFNETWLTKSESLCNSVITHFWDEQEGYFFFSGNDAEKLIARKKEVFDNVIPSSNSVMARNLFHLGTLLDKSDWMKMSCRMVTSLKKIITTEPSYASNWAALALETGSFAEIAIVGPDALEFRNQLCARTLFVGTILGTTTSSTLPLLADKPGNSRTTIYVCFEKTCKQPVYSVEEAISLLPTIKN